MTDENQVKPDLSVIAETLERLQMPAEDLLPYVEGLRARYHACVQTLVYMANNKFEDPADVVARGVLDAMGLDSEGNVSHETNEQDV